MKKKKGFTLVEIIIVIALIAILATIGIVALNPSLLFSSARNSKRSSDVRGIQSAISVYLASEGNTLASLGTISNCGTGTSNIGSGSGNVNLATTLNTDIPTDPSGGTDADTGYDICTSGNGRFTVSAPNAEDGETIEANG